MARRSKKASRPTRTRKDVIYEHTKNLIREIVWDHMKSQHRRASDFDEIFSRAHLHFMRAYTEYDPTVGELSTWLWITISLRLKNDDRKERNEHERKLRELRNPRPTQKRRLGWRITDMMDELHEDGRNLLLVVRQSLPDIEALVRGCGPHLALKRLYRFLLREKGWSRRQILSAFIQVRDMLEGMYNE